VCVYMCVCGFVCTRVCVCCCDNKQSVVVCCSELQCVVTCCSVLQCVAVRRNSFQCIAVCCSVLCRQALLPRQRKRYVEECFSELQCVLQSAMACCSVLEHVAVRCMLYCADK